MPTVSPAAILLVVITFFLSKSTDNMSLSQIINCDTINVREVNATAVNSSEVSSNGIGAVTTYRVPTLRYIAPGSTVLLSVEDVCSGVMIGSAGPNSQLQLPTATQIIDYLEDPTHGNYRPRAIKFNAQGYETRFQLIFLVSRGWSSSTYNVLTGTNITWFGDGEAGFDEENTRRSSETRLFTLRYSGDGTTKEFEIY